MKIHERSLTLRFVELEALDHRAHGAVQDYVREAR
jgi:hypothetical protein